MLGVFKLKGYHVLEDCGGPGCGASCACWCHAALRS